MTYFTKYDYTIIRRHWIILFFKYIKSLFFLIFALLLLYAAISYRNIIWEELMHIFIYPTVFILVNYAFIKLILWYIKFYNDLLIIYNWHLIVIKSSLFFKDDIEFIDINKITKLDTYCRWLIPNMLGYGNLVVEQQRDEARIFHFVPDLFKAIQILKNAKQITIDERKNTYVHSVQNNTQK